MMRRSQPAFWPFCFLAVSGLMLTAAQAAEPTLPAPLTAEQDHQNMMDQLRIMSLRPSAG